MIGSLLLLGRLGRAGFVFNLAIAVAMVVWAFNEFLPWILPENLLYIPADELPPPFLLTTGLALWLVFSSLVRRLRDAGSPAPLVELIGGLLVPVFGWFWLVIRLFLTGSKAARGSEAPAPVEAPKTGTKADSIWTRAKAGTSTPTPEPAPDLRPAVSSNVSIPGAPTVRRSRSSARSRLGGSRRIAF